MAEKTKKELEVEISKLTDEIRQLKSSANDYSVLKRENENLKKELNENKDDSEKKKQEQIKELIDGYEKRLSNQQKQSDVIVDGLNKVVGNLERSITLHKLIVEIVEENKNYLLKEIQENINKIGGE